MPHCFTCGKFISGSERTYKRELHSGTSQGINYGKRVSFNTRKYYSMKTVCGPCAESIDTQQNNTNKAVLVVILVIIIGILLYFLLLK